MKLIIRSRDLELTEILREQIKRRIYFSLSRFGNKVLGVSVDLQTKGGSGPTAELCCQILVNLGRTVDLRVEASNTDLHSAVSLAAARANRAVQRAVERLEKPDRLSPP
jgi:ribosomal subunit interface protein